MISQRKRAWVVSVNMGYGHDRAAHGLEHLAYGPIIEANDYDGMPTRDRLLWQRSRQLYERISRLQSVPLIGSVAFHIMDAFQRIPSFYPKRDLQAPTIQLRETYRLIERGFCKHLIDHLGTRRLPLITTFFLPAFAAEIHGYPEDIFCVVCDTDVSRAWAPLDPKKSRINYFAPNGRVVERLKLYGVRESRIFLTGFPLPPSLIGGPQATVAKQDLTARIVNLDPQHIFANKYRDTLEHEHIRLPHTSDKNRPLTLTFCIGGAGAQQHIALDALTSLRTSILRNQLHFHIVAGTHSDTARRITHHVQRLGLKRRLHKGVFVHVFQNRAQYFQEFSKLLRHTDVLWTKPSELSFYTGLGIPILIAPPLGSQEEFNKQWLETVNGGIAQLDPCSINEWLFDWVDSGGLARFAWSGFIEAPTHGAYRIENIVTGAQTPLAALPLIV